MEKIQEDVYKIDIKINSKYNLFPNFQTLPGCLFSNSLNRFLFFLLFVWRENQLRISR